MSEDERRAGVGQTDRSIDPVHKLREAGVKYALTSGRPPRGMQMQIEPLALDTPIAINRGLLVDPDMSVLAPKVIPEDLVAPIVAMLDVSGLDVWIYRGAEWLIRDLKAPHLARVVHRSVRADAPGQPRGLTEDAAKIVGVSDDHELVASVARAADDKFGDHVSAARSQPHYLDVTHPEANKGNVAKFLSALYRIPPEQIATIGDMPNDVLMFAHSGLPIAMGQRGREVHRAAWRVTTSNEQDGFATAVERFIVGTHDTATLESAQRS